MAIPPETVPCNWMAHPPHIGELDPNINDAGEATVAVVAVMSVHPLASVTVRLYVCTPSPGYEPEDASTNGSGFEEVKPEGPDQLYVYGAVPPETEELKEKSSPEQTDSPEAETTGLSATVTVTIASSVHPLASVTVTV